MMPIIGATLLSEIPRAMFVPHEARTLRDYGRTADQLAARGGLTADEAIQILEGLDWASLASCVDNERYLINLVSEWRAK